MQRLIQSNLIIKFKRHYLFSFKKSDIVYSQEKKTHSLQKVKLETTKICGYKVGNYLKRKNKEQNKGIE